MQLQVKPQKRAETMYKKANKQPTKYRLRYFSGFEVKRKVRLMLLRPKERF